MNNTIIVGDIKYMNRSVTIHSIENIYKATSQEGKDLILKTLKGKDYIVIQDYQGDINISKHCLLKLL